jgi:ubiquinone/menaquinone biosynthesis C-methylase UbiE
MERRLQIIKKEIEKVKTRNCKILDIGCGDGYLLHLITKQKKRKGIGIDISKKFIAYATSSHNKNCRFIVGDAIFLPIKSNSFNIVIAGEIIEHLDNTSQFLYETKRVLQTNGLLILSTPNLFGLWSIVHDHLKMIFRHMIKGYSKPAHVKLFTLDTLLKSLELNGYKINKVYNLGLELEKVLTRLLVKVFPKIWVKKLQKHFKKIEENLTKYISNIPNGWVIVAQNQIK